MSATIIKHTTAGRKISKKTSHALVTSIAIKIFWTIVHSPRFFIFVICFVMLFKSAVKNERVAFVDFLFLERRFPNRALGESAAERP